MGRTSVITSRDSVVAPTTACSAVRSCGGMSANWLPLTGRPPADAPDIAGHVLGGEQVRGLAPVHRPGLGQDDRPSWTRWASIPGRDGQEASERDARRSFAGAISSPTPRAQSRVSVVGDVRVGSGSGGVPRLPRVVQYVAGGDQDHHLAVGHGQDPGPVGVEPVPLAAAQQLDLAGLRRADRDQPLFDRALLLGRLDEQLTRGQAGGFSRPGRQGGQPVGLGDPGDVKDQAIGLSNGTPPTSPMNGRRPRPVICMDSGSNWSAASSRCRRRAGPPPLGEDPQLARNQMSPRWRRPRVPPLLGERGSRRARRRGWGPPRRGG